MSDNFVTRARSSLAPLRVCTLRSLENEQGNQSERNPRLYGWIFHWFLCRSVWLSWRYLSFRTIRVPLVGNSNDGFRGDFFQSLDSPKELVGRIWNPPDTASYRLYHTLDSWTRMNQRSSRSDQPILAARFSEKVQDDLTSLAG